jgi:uncharacterized membrane protein YeaQ/YmgE (transglycosylase-associated protein family)
MKHLAIFLLASGLALTSFAQTLPDNPAPLPLGDPEWNRLQSLTIGQPIVVGNTSGPPVHCLFAGVTAAYLFCNPPGNPQGVGFRFDHADVLSVDFDSPHPMQAQISQRQTNYHPAWISSMIAGGMVVGLVASQNTNAGKAAQDGFIGAAVVGLIGAPFAFLPHPDLAFPTPAYPQYRIGLRLPMHTRPRRLPVIRRSH